VGDNDLAGEGTLNAKAIVEEAKASPRGAGSLSPEDWVSIDRWQVDAYLDLVLHQRSLVTKRRLERLFFPIADAARILGEDEPLPLRHILPVYRVLVDMMGGVTEHLESLSRATGADVPSRDEFTALVARLLVAWAGARGLIRLR